MKELLEYQQIEQRNNVKLQFLKYHMNKSYTVQEKWGKLIYLYGALGFLELADLLRLLSVSKEWSKRLTKKIYRTIFDRYGNNLTQKQRKAIWINLLQPVNFIKFLIFDS